MDVVALRGQSDREKDLEILLLRQQIRIVERKQVQRCGLLSRWEKLSLAVLLAGFKAVSRGTAERLGDKKLVGELGKLGYRVGRSTVRDVLKRHGIQPSPQRARRSWRTFLNSHKDSVLACDFFTVETLWLHTVYVLFFIELNIRRVSLAGCTRQPTAAWVTQQAWQFAWDIQSAPSPSRFLIHDRNSKFSARFDTVLMAEGIAIVRTPPQHLYPPSKPVGKIHHQAILGGLIRDDYWEAA